MVVEFNYSGSCSIEAKGLDKDGLEPEELVRSLQSYLESIPVNIIWDYKDYGAMCGEIIVTNDFNEE